MNPLSKKYGTYERQEELLEMLKTAHRFLKENGIVYSLCGGTLLGEIRENGFIPWDDDVDIMMDRTNYEKMIKTFSSEDEDGGLELKLVSHKFEDTMLLITAEYDNYLATQYGDYMIPPAEVERVPQHGE